MDCIAGMPSSAFTPSGFTLEQARTYVRKMALLPNVCYLHLPEAAPVNASDAKITGKALAYLTWDFISARISKK
jgi:formiminoglutamase